MRARLGRFVDDVLLGPAPRVLHCCTSRPGGHLHRPVDVPARCATNSTASPDAGLPLTGRLTLTAPGGHELGLPGLGKRSDAPVELCFELDEACLRFCTRAGPLTFY